MSSSNDFINKLKKEVSKVESSIEANNENTQAKSGTSDSSTFISKLKQEVANTPQIGYSSAPAPLMGTPKQQETPSLMEILGFYKIGEAPKQNANPLIDYGNLLGMSVNQGAKDAMANIGSALGNYAVGTMETQNKFNALNPTIADTSLQALANENPLINGFFNGVTKEDNQNLINNINNKVDDIYTKQEKNTQAYQKELAGRDLNTLQQMGVDVASGVGGMVPSIVTSLATGGAGAFVPLFLSASGGKMKEVYDTVGNKDESTRAKALLAGTLAGSVEMATEKLFGFTKLFGGTLELDKALSNYLTKNATNEVSKVLINTLVGMAGEGVEEAISEYADAFITKIYNDNGQDFVQTMISTTPDALYAALVGGLTGAVLEANSIVSDTRNAMATEQQKKQVLKNSLSNAANEAANTLGSGTNANAQPQMQANSVVSGKMQNNAQMAQNEGVLNYKNITTQDQDNITKLANRSGTKVAWFEGDNSVNGYYQNGTIYLNKNKTSSDNYTRVFVHELTHHLESSGMYSNLESLARDYLTSQGKNLEGINQEIVKEYSQFINGFTSEDANREIIAKFAEEQLFKDQAAIEQLARTDRNLFQKVYDWIKDTLRYVTSNAEKQKLMDIERMYAKALNDVVMDESNVLYVDSDKKRTSKWEFTTRLQLPVVSPDTSSINSISQNPNLSTDSKEYSIGGGISKYGTDEHTITIPAITIDPTVAFFEDERPQEFAQYEEQERIVENAWRDILLNDNFKGAEFRIGTVGKASPIVITKSLRDGADYQVSYFDSKNIPNMHENYYLKEVNGQMDIVGDNGYSLFSKLANYSHDGKEINVNLMTDKQYSIGKGLSSYDSNDRPLSQDQQEYFKDSKVRDENGNLIAVYHGTVREFYTFDRDYANAEGDMGKGFYFTDNESDVNRNYANVEGPDLVNKIEREAEILEGSYEYMDMDHEEIVEALRQKYITAKDPIKHECYLNITNPCYVGENETYLLSDIESDLSVDDFEDEDEYYEYLEENVSSQLDNVMDAIYDNISTYDDRAIEDIRYILFEAAQNGGITLESLKAQINEKYIEDDNGNMVGNEIARVIVEALGYDGIIDSSVSSKFKNMGLGRNTTHYIVFDSNRAKLVDNENPTKNKDIRYSRGKTLDEYQRLAEEAKKNQPKKESKTVEKTAKVQKYEKAARNKLIKYLANEFNTTPHQAEVLVGDFIDIAKEQMQTENRVNPHLITDIFNKMADNTYDVDTQMSDRYKDVIEYLKNTTFAIDKDTRNGMNDEELREFMKRHRGKFKLGAEGVSITSIFDQLTGMDADAFPADTNAGDMLGLIAKKLDDWQDEYTLKRDTYKKDPVMKQAAIMEFNEEYNNFLNKMRNAQNVTNDIANKKMSLDDFSYDEYKEQAEQIEKLKREYNRVLAKTVLDTKAKHYLDGLMNGAIEVDEIAPEYRNDVLALYKVKKPYEDAKNVVATYNNIYKEELRETARGHISQIEVWNIDKKKLGIEWELDTAERVIRDIAQDDAEGVIAEYFTPIHKNEADRTKFLNEKRDTLKALNLTDAEAAAVQMLGEHAVIDGKEYTEKDVIEAGLDLDKINNAIGVFKDMYNQLHEQVNEVLAKTGNKTIEFRKDYFPHFLDAEPDTKLGKMLKKMGINVAENNIPADIAGLTENFRPNKTWFGHALHRTTDKTTYDAIKGADKYLDGISNLIYHTEDIMKLRALDTEIRYQTSDEGFKKRIDEIYEEDLLPEERQEKLNLEYQKQEKISKYSNLTRWITNYTNSLANKKSPSDRQMENDLGRGMYTVCKELEGRVAANMIGGNLSSAMSNFIPITQAMGECKTKDLIKGMQQTMSSYLANDGFVDDSVFLTNRKGSERLSMTKLEEISNNLSIPFQMIDDFVSSTIVRAKYLGNIDKGMSHEEALSNADSYAASLMADRSKGAMPLIFERKNPVTKLFTMYQLEQNNQFRYLLKDLPRANKEEAVAQVILAIMRMSIAAWCFNEINESIFGRRSAFDPIDMAFETVEVLKDDKMKTSEKVTTVAKSVAEEAPFIGGLLGGGRIPISSAMPDMESTMKLIFDHDELSAEQRNEYLVNDIVKPLSYIAAPFGAGQAWKSYEGLKAVAEGGVYKATKDGKELKYPVEQNLQNVIQGLIGGKSSFKSAQEYYDKAIYNLSSDKLNAAYKAQEHGMDVDEFLELYEEVKATQGTKDKDGKTIANSASINKRKTIDSSVKDEKLRKYLYEVMDVSKTVQNYTDNEWFLAQRKVSK